MEIQGPIDYNTSFSFTVQPEEAAGRLDSYLASKFAGYSRTFFQRVLKDGLVKLNERVLMQSSRPLRQNDVITLTFPKAPEATVGKPLEKELGVELVADHEHFLVINKPAGLLVHAPSNHCTEATLVDWLLHHYPELASVGSSERPGIVHRLDRDTSGLMVVPRTEYAHAAFSALFKDRTIKKTYLAIVKKHPEKTGSITFGITRHPTIRTCMMHTALSSHLPKRGEKIRPAQTDYTVVTYFDNHTLIQARPLTGRTHQIRVHFAALRHPLEGDAIYGTSSKLIKRHALHAQSLAFTFDNKKFSFTVEPPQDFKLLIKRLKTTTS